MKHRQQIYVFRHNKLLINITKMNHQTPQKALWFVQFNTLNDYKRYCHIMICSSACSA